MDISLAQPEELVRSGDERLVDLVDGLLSHGVVLHGELWLTVADIDLVFVGVELLLTDPSNLRAT